jgi:ubiquinone/menaquinone biosynthesis C-methylase UbiE
MAFENTQSMPAFEPGKIMCACCRLERHNLSNVPNKEMDAYYMQGRESGRLANAGGELERLRTEAILAAHLPAPPAVILDVGGAAGAYAIALARKGYAVHLVDPIDLHVQQARTHAESAGVTLASISKGDARWLDFPSSSADALLLLGPLYHLIEREDRLKALREAWRVLRPGGVLFAAAISRFASLIDGLSRGTFGEAEFRKIVATDLQNGLHSNHAGNLEYFTTAFFHRPEELAAEVGEAGFTEVHLGAIEGPAWSTARFAEIWSDGPLKEQLLEFLSLIEGEPSLIGASAHFMAVAQRPG